MEEILVPLAVGSRKNSSGLAWDRTWVSEVRGRRMTACGMERFWLGSNVKVKCTIEQTAKAKFGARWGGCSTLRPGTHCTEWAPGPVWAGAKNLAPPNGIRFPDRPARSESLYRLR